MKLAQRIYCIEGHWDYGDREVEPSVEPILQMLRSMGQWPQYARRDCATTDECLYFLDHEWARCRTGSILYFATHGDVGEIWLSDNQVVPLETLSARQVDCGGCLVHFGGCNVLAKDGEARARKFMAATDATYVSGYARKTGWADTMDPPALALELMLFSSISTLEIDLTDGRSKPKMQRLASELRESLHSCEFSMVTKWD